jgi:tetratricopeptide (TPR) repeat protein
MEGNMSKKLGLALAMALMAGSMLSAATGVVRGSYINVRKEAKFDSPIVGKKMRGDRYEVEFTDNYWVKVKFPDGTRGWIYKTLIERTGDAELLLETPEEPEPEKTPEKKEEKKPQKKSDKDAKAKAGENDKKTQKKASQDREKKEPKKPAVEKKVEKAKPASVVEVSGSAEELYNEAIALYEERKYAQALDKNQQALKKAPQNAEILNNIGNCQFKMGRIQEALDSWKEALRVSPKSGKISNNLGIAYYQLDKNKEAIEYYKKAILFEPQFPDPYYNLASVYGFSGKFEDAIVNYKKFLEFSPDATMKKLAEERINYCERQLEKNSKKKETN